MAPSISRHDAQVADSHPEYDKLLDDRHLFTNKMAASAENGPQVSLAGKMLSATVGSLLTSLLVTPLDVVRVRLQSQQQYTPSTSHSSRPAAGTLSFTQFRDLPPNIGISTCCREVFWINNNAPYCVAGPTIAPTTPAIPAAACAAEETRSRQITSTFDGLRKIARNEGVRTLWRGLSPTLLMAIPANVIYFAGYDWLRSSPKTPIQGWISDAYAPLVAGSTARVFAAVAVSPIEMFRTRMQAAHHSNTATGVFKETLVGLKDMVQTQGIRSLWRGLTLTLWRDVPFSAIYWWGYESGRNVLTDMRGRSRERESGLGFDRGDAKERKRRRSRSRSTEDHTSTLVDSFIAGSASGAFAALITTPFDVGKTRQQVIQHARDGAGTSKNAQNAARALKPEELSMPRFLAHIFREQGLPGLFKGWAARCLKVAPACAIMISSYEMGKKMAGDVKERRYSTA